MQGLKRYFHNYVYLKLCWNRSLSHLNIPFSIVDKVLMIMILLKIYGINNIPAVTISAVFFTLAMLILGHYDLKIGVAEAETSLSNKYNPEITLLVKQNGKTPRNN
jgi:hypothetical protein